MIYARIFKMILASSFMLSLQAFSQEYKRCEVQELKIDNGMHKAVMECYEGSDTLRWESGHHLTVMPQFDYQIDWKKCNLSSKAHKEKLKERNKAYGYCVKTPNKVMVEVSDIDSLLSFFYMGLKDNLVLLQVVVEDGRFVSGSIARHQRYDHYSVGAPAYSPIAPPPREMGDSGKVLKALVFSRAKACNEQREYVQSQMDALEAEISYYQDMKNQCKSTVEEGMGGGSDVIYDDIKTEPASAP